MLTAHYPRSEMPALRSGKVTSPDPDVIIADLLHVPDRESAAETLPEGQEWVIVCVKFRAPEFGKPHTRKSTWTWWVRFRASSEAKACELEHRAMEVVTAQYAPPIEYQKTCDLCQQYDTITGRHTYYVPEWLDIQIMPRDMETSDDDYEAKIGPERTIAACEVLKTQRSVKEARAAVKRAAVNEMKTRHARELAELEAAT
jgi:hypothetical protein